MSIRSEDLGGNLLLGALRPADRALLAPFAEVKVYRRGEMLFDVGEEISCISFPTGQSVAALVITMQDGRTVETANIGHEGAIGGIVSQGGLPAFSRALVQISGPFIRIDTSAVQAAKRRSEAIRNLFTRYSDCLLAQVLQLVACNAVHPIGARCARWLLTLQERLGGDALPVTHEMLAELLGVQRSYLTRTLRALQNEGLIEAKRGRIIVSNRENLEDAACECRGVIKQHFERVLGAVYDEKGTLLSFRPRPSDQAARSHAL
ncbi:Crp/Fnr family transcriptional regulator [Enterovirga sp. CN4-39]|uniref:Crp/Fnr family transcriptional regulator n=1 Tax=Enterovirga sp. CN4-39 TaxID=3400910 RepID=UPI003C06F62D